MAQNKTQPTKGSAASFLDSIEDEAKRRDAKKLAKLMRRVSGAKPVMWGSSIVGFGKYHYKYESGREGDGARIGFSPRAQNLVVYITPGFSTQQALMKKLGKHKTGRVCLYIKRLDDIDLDVLEKIASRAWREMEKRYPELAQA